MKKKKTTWVKHCVVKTHHYGGWGNGYIGIPKGHLLYECDYDDAYDDSIKVEPHGGWSHGTFKNPVTGEFNEMWWIGFDTNHLGDNLENCSEKYVRELTIKLSEAYSSSKFQVSTIWEVI
jgi:hypothetical protein